MKKSDLKELILRFVAYSVILVIFVVLVLSIINGMMLLFGDKVAIITEIVIIAVGIGYVCYLDVKE